jgi:hypothetical protein
VQVGQLEARRFPKSSYWKIPLASVLAFEELRAESDRRTAEWSRDLDAMGAPAE